MGRRPWAKVIERPEDLRDVRPVIGAAENESSETAERAVAGVEGLASRASLDRPRSRDETRPSGILAERGDDEESCGRGRGTDWDMGDTPFSEYAAERGETPDGPGTATGEADKLVLSAEFTSSCSASSSSENSGMVRTSWRNSWISFMIASRSSGIVWSDSTSSHFEKISGQSGSSSGS